MLNANHRAVRTESVRYTTQDLGWSAAKVTGVIEDSVTGGHFLVRLTGTCDCRKSVIVLLLEWDGRRWEVIDETDDTDWVANNVPVVCAYCCARVKAEHIIGSVCRTCHSDGIEA